MFLKLKFAATLRGRTFLIEYTRPEHFFENRQKFPDPLNIQPGSLRPLKFSSKIFRPLNNILDRLNLEWEFSNPLKCFGPLKFSRKHLTPLIWYIRNNWAAASEKYGSFHYTYQNLAQICDVCVLFWYFRKEMWSITAEARSYNSDERIRMSPFKQARTANYLAKGQGTKHLWYAW